MELSSRKCSGREKDAVNGILFPTGAPLVAALRERRPLRRRTRLPVGAPTGRSSALALPSEREFYSVAEIREGKWNSRFGAGEDPVRKP